jgi:methylmalonyl-CoA/ethylmalonyl-CoA epimerase
MQSKLIFDHLGLVVPTLEEGRSHLAGALDIIQWTTPFDDAGIGVSVQFGKQGAGGPAFELIAPLGPASPVAGALRSGKQILSHVAYRTDDIAASGERLREQGCVATGPAQGAVAYGGRPVQFFVSPLRFMIELIEAPDHEHLYTSDDEESKGRAGLPTKEERP